MGEMMSVEVNDKLKTITLIWEKKDPLDVMYLGAVGEYDRYATMCFQLLTKERPEKEMRRYVNTVMRKRLGYKITKAELIDFVNKIYENKNNDKN